MIIYSSRIYDIGYRIPVLESQSKDSCIIQAFHPTPLLLCITSQSHSSIPMTRCLGNDDEVLDPISKTSGVPTGLRTEVDHDQEVISH